MKGSDLRDAAWRKSSWTGSQGNDCVEVAPVRQVVAVRDSKDPDGPVLAFGRQDWGMLLDAIKGRGV